MALRTEDIPREGVALFQVTDFGRWERVGRLRGIRYCCVTCAYCNGVACVVFRPDFVKATQTARVYDPALARQIDQRCHTCAVRVQWKNQSARIYLCYPQMNLIDCLKLKRDFRAEIVDLKRAPHRTKQTPKLIVYVLFLNHIFICFLPLETKVEKWLPSDMETKLVCRVQLPHLVVVRTGNGND